VLISIGWAADGEGEELIAGFLQAVGDGAALQPPFGEEQLDGSKNGSCASLGGR